MPRLWSPLTGVVDLLRARVDTVHRTWWTAVGVLSLVAGVVLLVDIGAAAALLTVAVVVGVCFLLRAAGELSLALRLRRLEHGRPA